MASPILDTFKDVKFLLLSVAIMTGYGVMLLFFDQFLFFVPYFTLYVPLSAYASLVLDLALTFLTAIVLTVSVRQILLQRQGGNASKTGILGIVAALVAGACPCYYLVPLLAVAGAIGSTFGALGILLNAFQIPIKLGATFILMVASYKLNKSGVCKIKPKPQAASKELRNFSKPMDFIP
ncbi:MAG: hypothetical protein ABSD41_00480 [Candidatus Bathyarchaeia archaeon]|jgi:hypothetical protein